MVIIASPEKTPYGCMLLAIVSSNNNMVVKAARNGPLPSRAVVALIDRGIRSLIEQADDGIFTKVLACVNYMFSITFQNTRASCKKMILSTATQQKPLPSLIGCRFICWAIRSISDPSVSSQCTTTDRTMTRV